MAKMEVLHLTPTQHGELQAYLRKHNPPASVDLGMGAAISISVQSGPQNHILNGAPCYRAGQPIFSMTAPRRYEGTDVPRARCIKPIQLRFKSRRLFSEDGDRKWVFKYLRTIQ